jgi:nucleotide-binding universal stress UspA family protein
MYRRILVPLDGSERAEKVLPFVEVEGKAHGSTVVLLRVISPLRHSLMMSPANLEEMTRKISEITQDYLEQVAGRLREKGLKTEIEIQSGSPAQSILEFAESTDCDLIVIGSRGDTGAVQWRFGSVANKVVKTRTSMPVLVVNT